MNGDASRSRLLDAPLGEVLVCTAENSYRLAIPEGKPSALSESDDHARAQIVVGIDGGAYRQYIQETSETLRTGQLQIVNRGSWQQQIDFVGIDSQTGLLLRIQLYELSFPFIVIDQTGLVTTGRSKLELLVE